MDINKLNELITTYFPLGNDDRYSEDYYQTPEIKRLEQQSLYCRENQKRWDLVKSKLGKNISNRVFHDVSFKYDNFLTRCYSLVSYLGIKDNIEEVLDFNISFIAPFYTIGILQFNVLEKHLWQHPPTVSFDFAKYGLTQEIDLIRLATEDIFKIEEFPQEKLNEIIPHISFENLKDGEFTYFNAFFCNRYQIRF